MVKQFIILAMAILLSACSNAKTVRDGIGVTTVALPTIVKAQPPAELLAPLVVTLPAFIQPSNSNATSALDPFGEQQFKILLIELTAQIKAWRAWAGTPVRPP